MRRKRSAFARRMRRSTASTIRGTSRNWPARLFSRRSRRLRAHSSPIRSIPRCVRVEVACSPRFPNFLPNSGMQSKPTTGRFEKYRNFRQLFLATRAATAKSAPVERHPASPLVFARAAHPCAALAFLPKRRTAPSKSGEAGQYQPVIHEQQNIRREPRVGNHRGHPSGSIRRLWHSVGVQPHA